MKRQIRSLLVAGSVALTLLIPISCVAQEPTVIVSGNTQIAVQHDGSAVVKRPGQSNQHVKLSMSTTKKFFGNLPPEGQLKTIATTPCSKPAFSESVKIERGSDASGDLTCSVTSYSINKLLDSVSDVKKELRL